MNENIDNPSSQTVNLEDADNDELRRRLWVLKGNIGVLELEVELIEEELKRRGVD